MADTVAVKWLYPQAWDGNPPEDGKSGWRTMTVQLTNLCDGTGESGVTKVDLSELRMPGGAAPTRTAIENIKWDIQGFTYVKLVWDRAAEEVIAYLAPGQGEKNFKSDGGLIDSGESGDRTGDFLLTTVGNTSGDSYDIVITFRLKA